MIRVGKKEDILELAWLWKDMVNELQPEWTPDCMSWIETEYLLLDTGMYFIVLAEKEGKIVGFVDGMVYYEPGIGKNVGIAKHFYIIPEHRGTHLMGRMYAIMDELARDKGMEIIELQCGDDKLEYWESIGFKRDQYLLRKGV